MAHVEPSLAFDHFSGKLSSKERIVMRTRYGRTHAYAYNHPYKGPISENRKPIISDFTQASKQCKLQMADPQRLAYWQTQYAQYTKMAKRHPAKANERFIGTKTDKYYVSLRGFIIASLSVQLRTVE